MGYRLPVSRENGRPSLVGDISPHAEGGGRNRRSACKKRVSGRDGTDRASFGPLLEGFFFKAVDGVQTCSLIWREAGGKEKGKRPLGLQHPAIRLLKESRPTSKSLTKKCTANRSEFPLRRRPSSFRGSREGEVFRSGCLLEKGATAESSIFVRGHESFPTYSAGGKYRPLFQNAVHWVAPEGGTLGGWRFRT